jgi:uncharacterized protein (DUF1330 family)
MNDAIKNESRRDFFKAAGTVSGAAVITALLATRTANAQEESINAMTPTPEQFEEFMNLPGGSVSMVNLLKFRRDAQHEYTKYTEGLTKILTKIGAELVFSGDCKGTLIGAATWDSVGIVRYPDKTVLMRMIQSPEYEAIHRHRESGLEGQVNLAVFENTPPPPDDRVTADDLMSQMDTNGDGKIDMDEAPEELKNAFEVVDTNADGGIDVREAQTIADFINNGE